MSTIESHCIICNAPTGWEGRVAKQVAELEQALAHERQQLDERQRTAVESMAALAGEIANLRDNEKALRTELAHERGLREAAEARASIALATDHAEGARDDG